MRVNVDVPLYVSHDARQTILLLFTYCTVEVHDDEQRIVVTSKNGVELLHNRHTPIISPEESLILIALLQELPSWHVKSGLILIVPFVFPQLAVHV